MNWFQDAMQSRFKYDDVKLPWCSAGGKLLLELNRVLRPGGHFVWSATPVYQDLEEDKQIWKGIHDEHVSEALEVIEKRCGACIVILLLIKYVFLFYGSDQVRA